MARHPETSRAETGAPDYRALFEGLPDAYLVLAADLTVVAVDDAWLVLKGLSRSSLVGRPYGEILSAHPDAAAGLEPAALSASLERVLATGVPDGLVTARGDRRWQVVHAPVLESTGRIRYVVQRWADATEDERARRQQADRDRHSVQLQTRVEELEVEIFRRAQEASRMRQHLDRLRAELAQRASEGGPATDAGDSPRG